MGRGYRRFRSQGARESAEQALKNLQGVKRRAFAKLIAADKHFNSPALGLSDVPANSTYKAGVATRSVDRHRKHALVNVVDNFHARGRPQNIAHLIRGYGIREV